VTHRIEFSRGDTLCIVNVAGPPLPLPGLEVLLASEPLEDALEPGAASWFRRSMEERR
jgi:hypothetical protein